MEPKSFCKMEFAQDHEGKEILLKDDKFQVMMEWEKPYMQACIDALKPEGEVLEIGFGIGYASTHIQTYRPASHTIIEYHPVVADRAREWAKGYSGITIIENTWQNALKSLGTFDRIFFDDYPLENEREDLINQEKKKYAHSILEGGQKVLDEVHEKLSFLKTISYTQKDIEDFFAMLKRNESNTQEVYLRFFLDLRKNNNIDDAILKYAIEKMQRENLITPQAYEDYLRSQQKPPSPFQFRAQGDRLFNFLQLCLENHMKKDSVFSCYLEDPISKFEDEKFMKNIITNPFLEYKEEFIPIQVPQHCAYYKGDKALVITIKKM